MKLKKRKYTRNWRIRYKNEIIKITNWWSLNLKTEAKIFLNEQFLGLNNELNTNPFNPVFHFQNPTENIKEIKVFLYGFFSLKLSLEINGKIFYRDKLNFFDQIAIRQHNRIETFFDKIEIKLIQFINFYWERKKNNLLEKNKKMISKIKQNFQIIDSINKNSNIDD